MRFVANIRMATDSLQQVFVKPTLRNMGLPEEIVRSLTAHSIKITFLGWCAKTGIEKKHRRKLGGHSKNGETMVDLYNRDLLSEPLRQLPHGRR